MGTNAWLKVGCKGDFNPEDVEWKVVSGPGRIVETNGYCALVEPTSQYDGDVVVEARFGHDSRIQPRFTMPVREKIRIPVVAYIVDGGEMDTSISDDDIVEKHIFTADDILEKLQYANRVFSQVGVEFFMEGAASCITNGQFKEVSEYETLVNEDGTIRTLNRTSSQAINLFTMVPETNAIKLFFVERIVNGTSLAFASRHYKSCVYSCNVKGSRYAVPHELGHVLGLDDIYTELVKAPGQSMTNINKTVNHNTFPVHEYDWWNDEGRCFYDGTDTNGKIIQRLLMHGKDSDGTDIPMGFVRGIPSHSMSPFIIEAIKVGASWIEWR